MSASYLIRCMHGVEDAERATLPFIVAATAHRDNTASLTAEAARIAAHGYGHTVRGHGMTALTEVMQSYLQNGGTIWACGGGDGPR